MKPVVTLTVNPAVDAACVADEVVPMHKVRTRNERYDAGGGGINVARMIRELGGETVAFYLAGGITGQTLERLIERCGLAAVRVPIGEMTRVSHTVFDQHRAGVPVHPGGAAGRPVRVAPLSRGAVGRRQHVLH